MLLVTGKDQGESTGDGEHDGRQRSGGARYDSVEALVRRAAGGDGNYSCAGDDRGDLR